MAGNTAVREVRPIAGAHVMPPVPLRSVDDTVAASTSEGHMLTFPVSSLPQLAKGKGVKLINIPAAKLKNAEEIMCAIALVPTEESLKVHAGKRYKSMTPQELAEYAGERGRRGKKLPRGYQNVDWLENM